MKMKNNFFNISCLLVCLSVAPMDLVFAVERSKHPTKSNQKPSFESYPAEMLQISATPKLVLTTKLAKKYKTVITDQSVKEVNFAGHYRVATWGCGTDCRGFAIINKQTGMVYTMPGVELVAGVMGNDEERISFKPSSKLFIISGLINDEKEGKFYYLWSGSKFQFLAKFPLEKTNNFDQESGQK